MITAGSSNLLYRYTFLTIVYFQTCLVFVNYHVIHEQDLRVETKVAVSIERSLFDSAWDY